MNSIIVDTPVKLQPLWQPSRYKVLYGGRGGAKSWGVARTLLAMGVQRRIRVLCTRELQVSIQDSVHRLLSDQIVDLGLVEDYKVGTNVIRGKNGTEFFFVGLRHNTTKIKSYEGVDIVWVEEAATVTRDSWGLLIPTIRKPGSEIWITFNPELSTDETYQRFVLSPPSDSILIPINWRDNPWFPDVLKAEMEDLKARDPVGYENIWEGKCRAAVEGAIYAEEVRAAEENGRVKLIPVDPLLPVHTFWDLGYRDQTAVWFIQKAGFEYRVIDFYQNSFKSLPFYLLELQRKGYMYGTHHMPHDARSKSLAEGKSIEDMMTKAGYSVIVSSRTKLHTGILAVRAVFPMCFFDAERTFDGLQCLRRYRYSAGRDPMHDEFSHGADAFRTFAMAESVQWDVRQSEQLAIKGSFVSEYDPWEDKIQEAGLTVYAH